MTKNALCNMEGRREERKKETGWRGIGGKERKMGSRERGRRGMKGCRRDWCKVLGVG